MAIYYSTTFIFYHIFSKILIKGCAVYNFLISSKYQHLWDVVSQNHLRAIGLILSDKYWSDICIMLKINYFCLFVNEGFADKKIFLDL